MVILITLGNFFFTFFVTGTLITLPERVFFLVLFEGKGSFYIAQYPVRWIAQSALHFFNGLIDNVTGTLLFSVMLRECCSYFTF